MLSNWFDEATERVSNSFSGRRCRAVLLASGGSSGSHVLAAILAKYAPFIYGPEINLANRPDLFQKGSFKKAFIKGLMRTENVTEPVPLGNGRNFYIVPPHLFTNGKEYGFGDLDSQLDLVLVSGSWDDFVRRLVCRLEDNNRVPRGSVLVEHSPGVSASLSAAMEAVPGLRAIHIVRHPLDTIASMMGRRAHAPFFRGISREENLRISVRQWAYLNVCALQAEANTGYLRVRYEDLVDSPDAVTAQILKHLSVYGPEARRDGMCGVAGAQRYHQWRNDPAGTISNSSVGRYKQDLTSEEVEKIVEMEINMPSGEDGIRISDLISKLGYGNLYEFKEKI